jgi:hypothetical protein
MDPLQTPQADGNQFSTRSNSVKKQSKPSYIASNLLNVSPPPGLEAREMYIKQMVDIQLNDFLKTTKKSPGPIYKYHQDDLTDSGMKVPKFEKNSRIMGQGHHRSHTQVDPN